jgi:hypothetical protein
LDVEKFMSLKYEDEKKMRFPDGCTLYVYNRFARWQRIRINRRNNQLAKIVYVISVLVITK